MATRDFKNMKVNATELANVIGVSVARVSGLESKGIVHREKDRKFVLSEAVQSYVHLFKSKAKKDSPSDIFENARAKKMIASAQIEEIDLQKRRGELVAISDVTDIVQAEYAIVRQRLFTIPSKAALDVFSCETPQEVQELLLTYMNEALDELKYDTDREVDADQSESSEVVTEDLFS